MPRAIRTRERPDIAKARVFRALADPTRQRILRMLGGKQMRVSDLAAQFDISRPAISRHLRVLLEAGLVTVRAAGRERHYQIAPGPLRDAAARIHILDATWKGRLQSLGEELGRREE